MNPVIDQIRLDFEPGSLVLLNVILALLMLGVALDIKVADFKGIAKNPRGPIVGLICQLLVLPAATFVLVSIVDPLPSVALGMMLVAACPGGNVSNFLAWLSKGNTALSVGMTAVSSAAALVMTPLNVAFWASLNPKTAALLAAFEIDAGAMFGTVLLILGLPLALGMTIGAKAPKLAARVRKPLRIVGGLVFIGFVLVAIGKNAGFVGPAVLPVLGMVILHNAMALSLGYGTARLLRLPTRDARAIAIEVGIQNSGLGLALIFDFFGGSGGMAIVAAGWGAWHLIAGLTLAKIWSSRPVRDAGRLDPPSLAVGVVGGVVK